MYSIALQIIVQYLVWKKLQGTRSLYFKSFKQILHVFENILQHF